MNSIEEYRNHPGVNFSSLKHMEKSPAHFYAAWKRIGGEEERTLSQRLGTDLHAALLEPERFEREFKPHSLNLNSNAYKKDFLTECALNGWTPIKSKQYDKVLFIAEDIKKDRYARTLLELPGESERIIYFRDEETGMLMKAMLDRVVRLPNGNEIILDIKSTGDARESSFWWEIKKYKYYMQSSFYGEAYRAENGKQADGCCLVAIEKETYPYCSMVFGLGESLLAEGEMRNRRLINKVKECMEKNAWPRYSEIIEEIPIIDLCEEKGRTL